MTALGKGIVFSVAFVFCGLSLPASGPVVRIAKFPGDRAAAISYTFDDGLRDQYTLAVPMLNEVGFKGTFFIIPGSVAPSITDAERRQDNKRAWGGITWPELRVMAGQGHEIASHTWFHRPLPRLTPREVEIEMSKSIDEIKKQIGRPPLTIAFPFNQSTPEIRTAALKYHAASRDYQTGVGGEKTTVEWLDNWVEKQVRDGAWGIIMAHGIARSYAAFTDPEILRAHLRHVKSREHEIRVDTFANLARYVKERDDAKITISSHAPGRLVCVLAGSGALDDAIFDVRLTLVVEAPDITSAHAERSGVELPVRIMSDAIQVDAVPDKAPITVTWR